MRNYRRRRVTGFGGLGVPTTETHRGTPGQGAAILRGWPFLVMVEPAVRQCGLTPSYLFVGAPMSLDRRSTSRQHPCLSLVPLPSAEASTLRAATGRHPRTTGEPGAVESPGLLAVWCCAVGSTWTLELHQPTRDTTLGPLVDWISSDVPTSHPEPDEAAARALLAQHGLHLYSHTDAGPRTHTRRSIGYVSAPTPSPDASAAAPRPASGALDTGREAPAGVIPRPRFSPPDSEFWTTERLQGLLLRVVHAADLGLLLPHDADWIRAHIRAHQSPCTTPQPPIRENPTPR